MGSSLTSYTLEAIIKKKGQSSGRRAEISITPIPNKGSWRMTGWCQVPESTRKARMEGYVNAKHEKEAAQAATQLLLLNICAVNIFHCQPQDLEYTRILWK